MLVQTDVCSVEKVQRSFAKENNPFSQFHLSLKERKYNVFPCTMFILGTDYMKIFQPGLSFTPVNRAEIV